ncbi:MAG: hypothetical protein N2Z20_05975 [Elusimicrobiales bacterium]|nr:hypothetical protein [Elusimicrobiales bacterium]
MKFIFIVYFSLMPLYIYTQQNIETKSYNEVIKKIKIKIHRFFHPGKSTVIVAVAGVRGNRFDLRKKIYWKTELSTKMQDKINEEGEVVKNIIKDFDPKKPQQIKDIKEYLEKNPNSFFTSELRELLSLTQNIKSQESN